MSETKLQTIGYIHTGFAEKFGIPRQSRLVDVPGYIELVPPFNDPNALRGLEEFSHIWVLWQFSESVNEDGSWGWTPTVRPPRLEGNERKGVFATRSPVRPNAIGMSCVELIAVDTDACRIEISGADMLDGLRYNGIRNGRQFITKVNLNAGGAAFYEGNANEDMSVKDMRQWITAVTNRTAPCVLPEQAYTVTRILEAIYESARTGKAYYFENN